MLWTDGAFAPGDIRGERLCHVRGVTNDVVGLEKLLHVASGTLSRLTHNALTAARARPAFFCPSRMGRGFH